MLASLVDSAGDFAYPVLFGIVAVEASGVPVPGETSLIAAGLLASQGKLEIVAVIALAAAGAIVGDNIGYAIGRRGGRWLLERPGRHGAKTVFFGRWILGLRVWASWLAGASRMRWPTFLAYNAAGGISWAITVGLLAYLLGHGAEALIRTAGLVGIGVVVLAAITGYLLIRRRHRRPAE